MRIFVDFSVILLSRVQFLWFFCQLVDRNLSYNQRKVFSRLLADVVLLI